jgi:hypothetical protein
MATVNTNRKVLDLKRWEMLSPAPVTSGAAMFIVSSRHYRQQQMYVTSNTVAYLYNAFEDGWVQVPSPALAGTFGAGSCGVAGAWSTGNTIAGSLTATAGTTTTLTTNQPLARDLRGYKVQILAGPNAGQLFTIASNTIGTNAVITFVETAGSAHSASSVYRLCTPVYYVLNAGALAANQFKKYCYATNTWTTLTQTGLPATVGTDSKLISTPSWLDSDYLNFATGTATAGGATTLTCNPGVSPPNWATNQWANSQVRIVSGTGAGQIRTIASNTGTVLTVSASWTVNPDATSVFQIQGNDDFLYYMGSGAVTLYRYSISANTWSTLSPVAARAAAPTTGMSGHWVWGSTDSAWTNQNAIQNGRYIYSVQGGATAALHRYDIAGNTWATITYSPATETFTTGTKYVYHDNYKYIHKDATGRWFRYNFVTQEMDGWTTMPYPNGAAVLGDTSFDITYFDGATEIEYIYMLLNTSPIVLRQMII